MKAVLKVIGALLGLALVGILGFYIYISTTWQKDFSSHPEPAVRASSDPEVIRRGEYLFHGVAHCSTCHAPPEILTQKSWPTARPEPRGGYIWNIPMFGKFVAPNITADTETGIGALSDGAIARVVRDGVGRDGRLVVFMQFAVGPMADEDLTALVSYIRTIPPVKNVTPPEEPAFIAKLVAGKLKPGKFVPIPPYAPPGGISVERGRYLANGPASCFGCHTPFDMMELKPSGPLFSGEGMAEPDFEDPSMEIAVPNLTPDPETGHIQAWSEEQFVTRFKAGQVYASKMPWNAFKLLTEEDVRSLYGYLRTLAPTRHDVGPVRRPRGWKPAK